MLLKSMALVLAASCLPACLPAWAQPPLTGQGSVSVVRGRAHVEEGAQGTYIHLEMPGAARSVTGFIPFGDEPTFRGLPDIEGRIVAIGGVVVLDGGPEIVMTDPNQLAIVR